MNIVQIIAIVCLAASVATVVLVEKALPSSSVWALWSIAVMVALAGVIL